MIQLVRKTIVRFFLLVLVELALIFGLAIGHSLPALAGDTPDFPTYGGKANQSNREVRQAPADLPKSVEENPDSVTKTIVEKLNLDEPIPDSTKKFFDQLKGDAPIEDTTHPEANY